MKDVFLVMLMTVAAVLGIVLFFAGPLLLHLRVRDAWKAIRDEAHSIYPQRFGKVRPLHVWGAIEAAVCASILLKLAHWLEVKAVVDQVCGWLLVSVFLWNAVWSVGVIRHRRALGARLVKFACWTLGVALVALVVLLYGFVVEIFGKSFHAW